MDIFCINLGRADLYKNSRRSDEEFIDDEGDGDDEGDDEGDGDGDGDGELWE